MSRIDDYCPDDTASFLRSCAFSANVGRAVAGKKGRKFLLELEAALIALPNKRLTAGALADARSQDDTGKFNPMVKPEATGEVCALGAVALKRKMSVGAKKEDVLADLANRFDPEEDGWELIKQQAEFLNICMPLAYAVVYENDEHCGSMKPEERYNKILTWVRETLAGHEEKS